MEMEDEDGGLFNIEVGSVDSADDAEKIPRDFQSEEDYLRQKKEWKVKSEDGEVCVLLGVMNCGMLIFWQIWKSLKLPIDNPTKPQSQTILHAIEELYFYRRYEEARNVACEVLKGRLNEGFRGVVEGYRGNCEAKIKTAGAG